MELFSQVVVMGGWLLSVLVKEGSKGTCSIVAKLSSSTCGASALSPQDAVQRTCRWKEPSSQSAPLPTPRDWIPTRSALLSR